ncbi:hypothetical protein ONZ45_g15968 [Pleurotus djamor]|nr:hypothetical protein ONZ45_g15968 [Pleurotus djamor]
MNLNFNLLVKFTVFALFALLTQAQSNVSSNFTASSTQALLRARSSIIRPVPDVLEIRCLLLVRQKGNWKDPNTGNSGSVSFGPYKGNGNTVAVQFKDFNVPNGVLINEPLDVSASSDIDLDLWFTVDFSSPCVAHYTCTGSVFKYTSTYTGLTCGGSPSPSPSPSPSDSAPVPSGTRAPKFGQCGGIGWTGPTACVSGSFCTILNPFFSECL